MQLQLHLNFLVISRAMKLLLSNTRNFTTRDVWHFICFIMQQ